MARIANWTMAAAVLAASTSLLGTARAGDDDDLKSLMADCGKPDVDLSDINGCLERARELSETAPSPQLQSLTAQLERRAENGDSPERAPAATPAPPAGPTATTAQGDPPAGRPDSNPHLSALSQAIAASRAQASEDAAPRELVAPDADAQVPAEPGQGRAPAQDPPHG